MQLRKCIQNNVFGITEDVSQHLLYAFTGERKNLFFSV